MENKQVEILLVEDNPDDQEIVRLAFEKNSNIVRNRIHFAKDGAEALEYLFDSADENGYLNHRPTLILLDLNLPKLNGLELLEKIREHPKAKNIPVAILTSSSKKADWLDTHSLGIDCFIHKSADFNQIVEAAGWILMEAVTLEKLYSNQ